jgi:hypothetical protein
VLIDGRRGGGGEWLGDHALLLNKSMFPTFGWSACITRVDRNLSALGERLAPGGP